MYSPSEKLCSEKASLSDWKQWCRHLIEIHLSVLHGHILRLLKGHQSPNWTDEFEVADCNDERPGLNDRLVPILYGTPNHIIKNIKEASFARTSNLLHIPPSVATALPTICDIFGVATVAGLVTVDSGATETVGSPGAQQSVLSAVRKGTSHAKVEIDVEAGRAMTFKQADATTTCAYSLVWMQTPHG